MLTLCMIARNAEDSIARALNSVLPYVDHAVVVLAGHSTDRTEEIVAKLLRSPFTIAYFYPEDHPEAFFEDGSLADFSAARNYALRFVPEGSHWMYIDSDDELIGGEKLPTAVSLLEEVGKEAGVVVFPYDYAHNDLGRPTLQQNTIRLFSGRVTDWQWQDRVHEWCKTEQNAPYKRYPELRVKHHRQPDDKRTGRNLRILQLMLDENPEHKRARLHLAEGLYASQQWERALDSYVRYYAQPEMEPHAYHCATQASKCCIELGDFNNAAYWAMVAIDMRPMFKDGYLLRARVAAEMEQWETTLFWLDQAADKHENTADTAISVWLDDYKWNAWNAQFTALLQLKRFAEAIAVATLALREYPENAHWTRELNLAEEADRIERSIHAVWTLAEHFTKRGDTLNAWKLLQDQNLPMPIRTDERILALRERIFGFVRHVWDASAYREFYTSEVQGHEINGTAIDVYRLKHLVESLRQRKAKKVLEVGTGAGGPAIWMLRQLPDVDEYVGLDINPDLVELANKAAEFHGFADRLRFECKDLNTYCIEHPEYLGSMGAEQFDERRPVAYFDSVLLPEIVEHMAPQDAHQLVAQAEEIGKSVVMTSPAMFCSDIPGINTEGYPRDHVKEWSQSDFEQLIFKIPRRRPVHIFKAYAPTKATEWPHIFHDREVGATLTYPYPGFASWVAEFDNRARPQGTVCIFTGAGPGWSPLDLAEKGLGGAETMAVKMAEQFAQNGHPVCIYGDWVGAYNGVIYRHWSTFRAAAPFLGVDAWLFISSRNPQVFDEKINADMRWLWVHDVDAGRDEMNDMRMENLDRILLLSEWHKQHWLNVVPETPEDKIIVTRNAIDPADFPSLFDQFVGECFDNRQRHRFVWPSSPDRGLDLVLEWWPSIREMWPDAELHVFYGFETIDAMSHLPGREWLKLFKAKIYQMANQPGVFLRGRVNQQQLHAEMASSQFWLYPSKTAFEWAWNETYCIAAVEAMAMGVMPVVADTGALKERLTEFGLEKHLVTWGAPRKAWLKALKAADVMPDEEELCRRWEIAKEINFENLYADWMRLVLAESLKDNANGRHNFDVMGTTASGR